MTQRKSIFRISLVSFIIAFGFLCYVLTKGLSLNPQKRSTPQLGRKIQPIKALLLSEGQGTPIFSNIDDKHIIITSETKYPMIINFWSSWCSSCRRESDLLESTWQEHKEQGLIVIGIAIQDTPADALRVAQNLNKNYLIAIDASGDISINFGVTGVPESYFVDTTGTVVEKVVGPLTQKIMSAHLPKILKSPNT